MLLNNMRDINNFDIGCNFSLYEFECPDCKCVKLSRKLLDMMEELREKLKKPIKINSGDRCINYNKQIGGYLLSKHMEGQAVDISLNGLDIAILEPILKEIFPFYYINKAKGYCHLQAEEFRG